MFTFFLFGGALCLGVLCAAPLALDIEAGSGLLLRARYLWFTRKLKARFRRTDLFRLLRDYAPVFCSPLRVRRFQVRLFFSTGEAAETALLHGWLCGFFSSLKPLLVQAKPEVLIGPSFSSRRELSLDCRISLGMPAALFLVRIMRISICGKRSAHV